ncbi:MAG: hypothetical protein V1886_03980 [archaeon]
MGFNRNSWKICLLLVFLIISAVYSNSFFVSAQTEGEQKSWFSGFIDFFKSLFDFVFQAGENESINTTGNLTGNLSSNVEVNISGNLEVNETTGENGTIIEGNITNVSEISGNLTCGSCQYIENHECVSYECCNEGDCGTGKVCNEHKCLSNNLSTTCGNNVCENQTLRLYTEKETAFVLNSKIHNFKLSYPAEVSHLFIDGDYEMIDLGNYYQVGGYIYVEDYGKDFLDLVLGENKNSCPTDCAESESCGDGICENQTMKIYEGEEKTVAIGNETHKVELKSIENHGGSFLGNILVDNLYLTGIYKEKNYLINDLEIYVNDIFWTGKEAYRYYVILTFGENMRTCSSDCVEN